MPIFRIEFSDLFRWAEIHRPGGIHNGGMGWNPTAYIAFEGPVEVLYKEDCGHDTVETTRYFVGDGQVLRYTGLSRVGVVAVNDLAPEEQAAVIRMQDYALGQASIGRHEVKAARPILG